MSVVISHSDPPPALRSDTMDSPGAATSIHSVLDTDVIDDNWPVLPPAQTTVRPDFQAFSTAHSNGSFVSFSSASVPYERLSTRIGFFGSSLRCATTQLIAAIICDTATAPLAIPTLIDVSFAPGDAAQTGRRVVTDQDSGHACRVRRCPGSADWTHATRRTGRGR
jgi:hypothetical protein